MALSALAPIALDLATPSQLPIAPGANGDMDIDMDIDLGPMEEVMVSDADTAQPVGLCGALSPFLDTSKLRNVSLTSISPDADSSPSYSLRDLDVCLTLSLHLHYRIQMNLSLTKFTSADSINFARAISISSPSRISPVTHRCASSG